jgi:hypothetical protein
VSFAGRLLKLIKGTRHFCIVGMVARSKLTDLPFI